MEHYFEKTLTDHYGSILTARELSQMKAALRVTSSDFIDKIIRPAIFTQGRYLSISDTIHVEGRNHDISRAIATGSDDLNLYVYFTNALKVQADRSAPDYRKPMDRVVMSDHHVVTMEFDSKDITFFQKQLSWFRSPNNPLDSPIGQFVRELRSKFADFAGLNVTYSGSKSFHYHFIFRTDLIQAAVPAPTSVRAGFIDAWMQIAALMQSSDLLNIPAEITPDPQLRLPEQYRRLPFGYRMEAEKTNFFGVPAGVPIPQMQMWEHITDRSVKALDAISVFTPHRFMQAAHQPAKRASTPTAIATISTADFTPEDFDYFGDRIREVFPDDAYPRFSHFGEAHGSMRAHFFNSPGDTVASSFIREDYSTVMIQGGDPLALAFTKLPHLPSPLGLMMTFWKLQRQTITTAPGGRQRTAIEQQFAKRATDTDEATAALQDVLSELLDGSAPLQILSAPEGISKTRSIIADIRAIQKQVGLKNRIMFAFATYEAASEKMEEFKARHGVDLTGGAKREALIPILVESFSRLYAKRCAKLKVTPLTVADAGKFGFDTLNAAISALQPEVMASIERHYQLQHRRQTGRIPIYFTVHDVAHSWHKSSRTRLMLSRAYFDQTLEPHERRELALERTRLGLLIHDELSPDHLLLSVREADRAWVSDLSQIIRPGTRQRMWPKDASEVALHDAFAEHKALNPAQLTFEEAIAIREAGDFTTVHPTFNEEYGSRTVLNGDGRADIYDAALEPYAIHVRRWPQTANRVLVLTTEIVPVVIARHLGGWEVCELDTPLIQRDPVLTHPDRTVTASNATAVAAKARAKNGGVRLIGNRLSQMSGTRSHHTAKGSNAYLGQPVAQLMMLMHPAQYAGYEALNAFTNRNDLVRLRHIDEFNQTAGRNLAFRYRPGASHELHINSRLYEALQPVLGFARYDMREVITQTRKREATRRPKKIDPRMQTAIMREKVIQLRAQRALQNNQPNKGFR